MVTYRAVLANLPRWGWLVRSGGTRLARALVRVEDGATAARQARGEPRHRLVVPRFAGLAVVLPGERLVRVCGARLARRQAHERSINASGPGARTAAAGATTERRAVAWARRVAREPPDGIAGQPQRDGESSVRRNDEQQVVDASPPYSMREVDDEDAWA